MNSKHFNGILTGKKIIVDAGDANLGEMILNTLKNKPDFLGQIDGITGEKTTYGQMAENSVRCALWLKKQGLKFRDVVFISCHNRQEAYIPIFANFYTGATLAFGYQGISLELATHLFNLMQPKFIFTEVEEIKVYEEAAKKEKLDVKIVTFHKVSGYYYLNDILTESELNEVNKFVPSPPLDPNDNCYLPLTSGTTRIHKIVEHSYKCLVEGLLVYRDKEKKIGNNVSLFYYPLFWSASLRLLLLNILNYQTRIIISTMSYDLDEIFQLIEKYKVTHVRFSLRVIYRMYKWKNIEKYDKSSIETIAYTGIKLPTEIITFLMKVTENGHLEQAYGTTEMFIPMCQGIMNATNVKSCGHLNLNTLMKIVDLKTGIALGPNTLGEICFKSPYFMKGYLKDPEATEEAIDPAGWYHTGDLGHYNQEGLIFIHGRIKCNSILSNGKLAPLWRVERALLLISEVIETCVLSDGDESFGTFRIVAFVVLLSGSQITESELCEIAKNCNDIKLPVTVKIVDSIPVTPNGKYKEGELFKQLN